MGYLSLCEDQLFIFWMHKHFQDENFILSLSYCKPGTENVCHEYMKDLRVFPILRNITNKKLFYSLHGNRYGPLHVLAEKTLELLDQTN